MAEKINTKPFILHSDFKPSGDQPQAIEKLVENLEDGLAHQTLLGVTGSGKTFTIGAGVGTYRGETAVAVGVKYAPKPNVVISLSGSADSRGGFGAATGVSLGIN